MITNESEMPRRSDGAKGYCLYLIFKNQKVLRRFTIQKYMNNADQTNYKILKLEFVLILNFVFQF